MNDKYEVVLQPDGVMKTRRVLEVETTFPNNVLEAYLKDASIHLGMINDGTMFSPAVRETVSHVNMSVSKSMITFAIKLNTIKFISAVRTIEAGKVLTPWFKKKEEKEPLVSFEWNCDLVGIPVYYGVQFKRRGTSGDVVAQKPYLFALHGNNNHRLPTSNVYEDCSICMGSYSLEDYRFNVMGSLNAQLEQFAQADWNSDLSINSSGAEKMFRFSPREDVEGLTQMEVNGNWPSLCGERINHGVLTEFRATIQAGG